MVHTALKIRADLLNTPGHDGFNISENEAIDCIPDSLNVFTITFWWSESVRRDR